MRIAVCLVAVCACTQGSKVNATLADLPGLSVGVQMWGSSDTAPTTGFIAIGYDWDAFRATHGSCAVVDIEGRRNGAALEDGSFGGDSDFPDECYDIAFDVSGDFTGVQTFQVDDPSLTVTAVYAAELFTPRVPVLASSNTWSFAAGEAVVVDWPVPSDLVGLNSAEPFQVWFNSDAADDFDLAPTFSADGQINFTIPTPAASTGPGNIDFRFGYSGGTATTCTNAAACAISVARDYAHSATIEN